MKLQYKAWALVLAIVGLAALGAMLGARHIVSTSFAEIESERAAREGERARRVFNQQLLSLSATVRDYAFWGDTVDHVHGRKPSFMTTNFDAENLGYLRISEVVVFDSKGQAISSVRRRGDESPGVVQSERVDALRPLVEGLLTGTDTRQVVQTLLASNGQLDLVVAAAVHRPEVAGQKAQGAIAMVRRFDDAELARLADVLMTPVRLSFDQPGHQGVDVHLQSGDGEFDQLHAVLNNQQKQPVAELVLSLDKRLQQQGDALSWTGMGLALLASLCAAALLVPLLDRLVLRRLQRLHEDLRTVTAQGINTGQRLLVQGHDEITTLANGINQLLDHVRDDAREQREAHERQEALQMQLMQSQKTEALGRLTGGIAHDFNNSLAAITGWVRLAAEDLDTEHPSHESLQQALKATRYADGLMRQLLAFGRQSAPKLRRLHWTNLIEETRQMVGSGLTRECQLVVDYQVDDDEVDADATQLQQVLVNLLINAADAMKGQGRIDLRLRSLDLPLPASQGVPPGAAELGAGRYLVLEVRDHGPGVPQDLADRIFEPFFTTKPKGRGTGLGLAVAQGIMARHHGAVGLDNRPGEGASFLLYLPVSRREASVAPITSPDGGPGMGRQILFVDDDQLVRHAWSALLERQGWIVTRSRDGEEAWAQYAQTGKQFDVVLTDQSMPRLDGVGLAQRIQATASPPPVVLMSGHVNEVPADLQTQLFKAVLHKPVEASELDRVLQQVLAPPLTVPGPI